MELPQRRGSVQRAKVAPVPKWLKPVQSASVYVALFSAHLVLKTLTFSAFPYYT